MSLDIHKEKFNFLKDILRKHPAQNWLEISELLLLLKSKEKQICFRDVENCLSKGIAFLTFDFGIDGVSIEISKYAKSLEQIYSASGESTIHLIAGDFYPQADNVLKPEWRRYKIEGINGWQKWNNGKWFSALYEEPIPESSAISNLVAQEIFNQSVTIAMLLGKYMVENEIVMLIPVNIASNPGNLALTLALVLVTEALETFVINSNHDFYWEGGKPESERSLGEEPGIRDHFFKNVDNEPFYKLFRSLYPWNGERWLQVNINRLQSKKLVSNFGFPKNKVFKLSTSVSDKFFEPYDRNDIIRSRLQMALILSKGQRIIKSVNITDHLDNLSQWMVNQAPILLGADDGLILDPKNEDLIVLLQPTRVIARKRIEKDIELINGLLSMSNLRTAFEKDSSKQLLLQITGPTPREHKDDLEHILNAYRETLAALPESIANRIFLGFSVGTEQHPSFKNYGFKKLDIASIYQIADAVLLPSKTEGRGLPIIESSAREIPIICSRYHPNEVFDGVVGETLSDDLKIKYLLFPEGTPEQAFINQVADVLINKNKYKNQWAHNKTAVRNRYSEEVLKRSFDNFINIFRKME